MPAARLPVVFLIFVLLSPSAAGGDALTAGKSAADFGGRSAVVVHYHRPSGDYEGWNLWVWPEGGEGRAVRFTGADDHGRYAVAAFGDRHERIGFIVRRGEWSEKDIAHDRYVTLRPGGVGEVWLVAEDPTVYHDPADIDLTPRITAAFLDALDRVSVRLSARVKPETLDAGDARFSVAGEPRPIERIEARDPNLFGAQRFDVVLADPLSPKDLRQPMRLEVDGFAAATAYARDALNGEAFTPLDARLGYVYSPDATLFRTWSPVAERVELLLSTQDGASRTLQMTPGERGLWSIEVPGDLRGVRYRYRFHSYGEAREAADVHGFAATADSAWSVVVDLDATDPPGFDAHEPPRVERPTDEVIYEVHVRDFSIHDPNVPPEHRGKYLGLTHTNARGTSLSHLKELGVTTVHLLPIQDFGGPNDEYNWGYWTELFNVPEARYATDPHDPAQTIRELKATIQALHAAGVRVVLDVVYNHTASSFEHSPFDQAVPWYWFRTDDAGRLRNEAGVGNAIADERPMVRKYIVDSLRYWLQEYKVDGFRFDLMGMHHPQTMRAIERELREVRPDVLLYGEPWTGGGPTHFPKGAQRGTTLAVFNDHLRNAIRGDLDGTALGFVMNGSHADAIRRGIMGSIDDFADAPAESINYASAHDNLTLWDKIGKAMPGASDQERRAMQKLALGVVLTSQGVPFLHGGSDFCRTKGGNHNSYNAGDEVNAFDWRRKERYRDVHAYVAGLIALRKAEPLFRLDGADAVRAKLGWVADDDVVAYTLDDAVVVALNGHGRPASFTLPRLPGGRWVVVVNHERAGTQPLATLRGGREVRLPPHSMLVLIEE